MKRNKEKSIRRRTRCTWKMWLFLFVLFISGSIAGQAYTPNADVRTTEEIRVGLKSKYAGKQSIIIYNTELELGFCDGREYRRETVLSAENGVTVTAEKGTFYKVEERMTLSRAEEVVEHLADAGVTAYAVLLEEGVATIYCPVAENGAEKSVAYKACESAAERFGLLLDSMAESSAYLIRIDTGERVLYADGESGEYPQFAAMKKDKNGIFAIDLGERRYRGRLEIGRYGGRTTLTAVNVVPLEVYLYGVVPCEMPASWEMEALKAQAVCARSYALIKAGYHAETDIARGYRMVDTVQSQVYGGISFEHKRSNAAVDATRGETLCYENRTVTGYYFSTSGGHTENIEDVWGMTIPYLQGVPDIYETNPSKDPWSVSLGREELAGVLRSEKEEVGTIKKVVQEVTTASGRVYSLRVIGSLKNVSLATDALRNVLELASTKFKVYDWNSTPDLVTVQGDGMQKTMPLHNCAVISGDGVVQSADGLTDQYVVLSADNMTSFPRYAPKEGTYLFAGMGHGHGVGMSQSGAYGMAEKGFTYKEILEHYFTGVTVR